MKNVILRAIYCIVILSITSFVVPHVSSQSSAAVLARWSSETSDRIGLTDGNLAEIYNNSFSLIESFVLPPITPASQISYQTGVWSPNLEYIIRIVLFDDTYTGESPNKAIFQLLDVNSQLLIFEYLGISIRSGIAWNRQSTQFAFAIPTGLGTENLVIYNVTGNQIVELTPPITGGIDRIAWNANGNRIAFNTAGNLHIWDFTTSQYLASPTSQFDFSLPLKFSSVSNQLAYIQTESYSVPQNIRIWDTNTLQEVGQLIGHSDAIYTFDWYGSRLASIGLDNTIRIWDTQLYQQLEVLDRGTISQVQLSPHSDMLLTNGPLVSTFQILDPYTRHIIASNYTGQITDITLINGITNQAIFSLENDAIIDLDTITSSPLKFRANVNPQTVGSVKFELNGQVVFTDDTAPYEYEWVPTVGLFTLTTTPYSGAGGTGTTGTLLEINFRVVRNLDIVSFSLIDPATNQPVSDYENLQNGMVLDYSDLALPSIVIRANTYPETLGSVQFIYQPPDIQVIYQDTDNTLTYDYLVRGTPFSARAYSGTNATGTAGQTRSLNVSITQSICHPNSLLYTYVTPSTGHDIFSLTVNGGHSAPVTTTSIESETAPQCAPSDNTLVYASDMDGDYEIFISGPDGGDGRGESIRTQLTSNGSADRYPVWSHDGSKIAFASQRNGNWDIYVMNADGSSQTRLTNNAAADLYPVWSPDGTRIAFQSNRVGNNEIYSVNPDGTNLVRLTNRSVNDVRPNWSPNGTRILFTSQANGSSANDIFVMNANGTNIQRLTTHTAIDDFADWSPDGTEIAFVSTRSNPYDQIYDIVIMNADGTNQRLLTTTTAYSESFVSWDSP